MSDKKKPIKIKDKNEFYVIVLEDKNLILDTTDSFIPYTDVKMPKPTYTPFFDQHGLVRTFAKKGFAKNRIKMIEENLENDRYWYPGYLTTVAHNSEEWANCLVKHEELKENLKNCKIVKVKYTSSITFCDEEEAV